MIYITGDTHRDFDRIEQFCKEQKTSVQDMMIVLGDAGINFYGNWRDEHVKEYLDTLPMTFLFIHGNHEMRPGTIPTYNTLWLDSIQGYVYREYNHPNLYFAIDGEAYTLNDKQVLVCGGAYSVDKHYRLSRGWSWWADEQPDPDIKARVEQAVDAHGGKFDYVLTHTCPFFFQPTEVFLPVIDQSTVDTSTEKWLQTIYNKIHCQTWFCGHFHTDKVVDNVRFMYNDIVALE